MSCSVCVQRVPQIKAQFTLFNALSLAKGCMIFWLSIFCSWVFSRFFSFLVAVWKLEVLVWLGIFQLVGVSGKKCLGNILQHPASLLSKPTGHPHFCVASGYFHQISLQSGMDKEFWCRNFCLKQRWFCNTFPFSFHYQPLWYQTVKIRIKNSTTQLLSLKEQAFLLWPNIEQ